MSWRVLYCKVNIRNFEVSIDRATLISGGWVSVVPWYRCRGLGQSEWYHGTDVV